MAIIPSLRDYSECWHLVPNDNKQSRTANKVWSSSLGFGRGAKVPHHKRNSLLRNVTQSFGIGGILWTR